jgi:hypothetical protein
MNVWPVWERLCLVETLSFHARPRSDTNSGWEGTGEGEVTVDRPHPLTAIFHERGTWKPSGGREMPFRNVYRWTADPEGTLIRLEHLRFGARRPVPLFDLIPVDDDVMESSEPHACAEDRYSARLLHDQEVIRLNWTIRGPRKDESLDYTYR